MEQRDVILTPDEGFDPARQAREQRFLWERLGLGRDTPFAPGDATAGTETELAVTVRGAAADVDLPRAVAAVANTGALPGAARAALSEWLAAGAGEGEWDHSWLRLDPRRLTAGATCRVE